LKWAFVIAVLAGFCYVCYMSWLAGILAALFGIFGFFMGFVHKVSNQVLSLVRGYAKDIFEGKVLTFTENEEGTISIYVTESKKKVSKK
jgi:hypothetical protein